MKSIGRVLGVGGVFLLLCPSSFSAHRTVAAAAAKSGAPENQLEQLARALKQDNPESAYKGLAAIASRRSAGVLGTRAALALGYFDYTKSRYSQAVNWLKRAQGDPLLRDYALYWLAEANHVQGKEAEALGALETLLHDYPDSVMTELALQSLSEAARALNLPAVALNALDGYPFTAERPTLLFERAQAWEQAGQLVEAAADYQRDYVRFATSDSAREAGIKFDVLRGQLGEKIPPISLDQHLARAAALFAAKQWNEARAEYARILAQLAGAEKERAELRILECGVGLGDGPAGLAALKVEDTDVDAERLYSLVQLYRTQLQEADMVASAEAAVARAPASHWAEAALFAAGNYYWVQLDREHATAYYRRVLQNFPGTPEATPAHWRIAWSAVLTRRPEAPEFLAEHLRRYPGSPFTPDALYWLGRLAEELENAALARAYYVKLADRFPENYFTAGATARLRALGDGPKADAEVLATIPSPPPALLIDDAIPPAAAERQARSDALRSIAFDSSAELELRAAYSSTGEPRLLLEAAEEAVRADHCGAAILAIRQIYPQLESHPFDGVPKEVWQAAYPLAFESSIRRWASLAGLDPMLVAGLVRQESAFDPQARSSANALGLMQLLPRTARKVARQARVKYSTAQLFDPDYNLHLGTIYLAGLLKDFGGIERALAAYNGGEDRVTSWTAGQLYREPAEFVDSIPFTETREYVEIITRNADIYRRLYGAKHESSRSSARRKR